jgi:hypothetical protein
VFLTTASHLVTIFPFTCFENTSGDPSPVPLSGPVTTGSRETPSPPKGARAALRQAHGSTLLTVPDASTLLPSTSLRDSEQRRAVGVPEQGRRERSRREGAERSRSVILIFMFRSGHSPVPALRPCRQSIHRYTRFLWRLSLLTVACTSVCRYLTTARCAVGGLC